MVKSFDKLYALLGKKKLLLDWKDSIKNHLWRCIKECGGDEEKLVEDFKGFLNHIQNKHRWRGKNRKMTGCKHRELSPASERKKKWIKPDTHPKEFHSMKKILLDEKYLGDLKKAAPFVHTGPVERINNQALKYLPKYIHFNMRGMTTRRALTNLEQNKKLCLPSKVKAVDDIWNKKSSKRTLRKRYEQKPDNWRVELQATIMKSFLDPGSFLYNSDLVNEVLYPLSVPRNISKAPKMTADERELNLRSRM